MTAGEQTTIRRVSRRQPSPARFLLPRLLYQRSLTPAAQQATLNLPRPWCTTSPPCRSSDRAGILHTLAQPVLRNRPRSSGAGAGERALTLVAKGKLLSGEPEELEHVWPRDRREGRTWVSARVLLPQSGKAGRTHQLCKRARTAARQCPVCSWQIAAAPTVPTRRTCPARTWWNAWQ